MKAGRLAFSIKCYKHYPPFTIPAYDFLPMHRNALRVAWQKSIYLHETVEPFYFLDF